MARKTDIRLRRSNTEAAIPTHSNLSDGEMAMNTMDGALYFKKSDDTVITVHDDSIMHVNSSIRALELFESVKRDSNNTAYTSGDATGFEYKEAVQIRAYPDEGAIRLRRTISNGGDRESSVFIRANGTSTFNEGISIGGVTGETARFKIASPDANAFISATGSNTNAASDQVLFTLDQVINSSTNTTSSGRIRLHTSTDGTQSTSISLNGDGDSFFVNPLRIGRATGSSSTNTSLSVFNSTGASDILEVIGNNSNSSITSGTPVALFKQRVNSTTNTTTSGELEINNILEVGGSAVSVPRIRLASDVDEDSFVLGTFSTTDQIITGTLTADKVPLLASALGWVPAFGTSDESKIVWDSSDDAIVFTPATASGGLVHTAFRVYAGQKVHITLPQKASSSSTSGLTIKVYQHNGDLPTGKTHVGDTAIGAFSSFMQDDDAQYTIVSNAATSTTWINRTLEFTPTADGYASIGVSVTSAVGTKKILLKQPKITNAGIGIGDVIAIQYLLG